MTLSDHQSDAKEHPDCLMPVDAENTSVARHSSFVTASLVSEAAESARDVDFVAFEFSRCLRIARKVS